MPPTLSTIKLNFNGVAHNGLEVVGGVLWNEKGDVLLAFLGNVGQGANNVAESLSYIGV